MIYKSLSIFTLFVLLIGTNTTYAQDEPCDCACDCIEAIETAVADVMATSGCDADLLWEAPHALEVHLKKLQNWCGPKEKPLKSKIPNIVEGMLGTIEDAYAGEYYTDLDGNVVWTEIPAPDCAISALDALKDLLENGCPVVE